MIRCCVSTCGFMLAHGDNMVTMRNTRPTEAGAVCFRITTDTNSVTLVVQNIALKMIYSLYSMCEILAQFRQNEVFLLITYFVTPTVRTIHTQYFRKTEWNCLFSCIFSK